MRTSLYLLISLILCLGLSRASDASLIDNLDGTITQIREDGSMLMWLQDFSLSGQSPSAFSGGRLRWDDAVAWADQLSFAGHDDWRLPTALNFDGSGPESGFNVTTSEFGNLYYLELGGTVGAPDGTSHLATEGPFLNINFVNHWASDVFQPMPENRWGFGMGTGIQADVGCACTVNHTVGTP